MILVDTDVMIDLLRQYPPALAWVNTLDDEEVLVPGFVVMELIQGSRNKLEQEKVDGHLGVTAWPGPHTRLVMTPCLCLPRVTSVGGSAFLTS